MPQGGGQSPSAYEISPPPATSASSASAMASAVHEIPTASSQASAPWRSNTINGAAISGTTTCSIGKWLEITRADRSGSGSVPVLRQDLVFPDCAGRFPDAHDERQPQRERRDAHADR